MPAKVKTKPKKAVKPAKKTKKAAPKKLVPALQCGVCGYRVIVDQTCGCVEEHLLLCCAQPMVKTEARA